MQYVRRYIAISMLFRELLPILVQYVRPYLAISMLFRELLPILVQYVRRYVAISMLFRELLPILVQYVRRYIAISMLFRELLPILVQYLRRYVAISTFRADVNVRKYISSNGLWRLAIVPSLFATTLKHHNYIILLPDDNSVCMFYLHLQRGLLLLALASLYQMNCDI